MKVGKPTIEEIKDDLLPKCEEFYNELHNKAFANDEKFYELDFKDLLEIPVEFANEGIVLPTGRDMIDTFVNHIDISNARVTVNRRGTSQAAYEIVEMMQKLYLGLIYRTNVESDISPWRVAGKHYALHGLAVFKDVWDADRGIDKPSRNEDEPENDYAQRVDKYRAENQDSLPVVIQAVNPRCIMPDPSYGGRSFLFEKRVRTCFEVQERWPHWSNPNSRKLSDMAIQHSFWTPTYRCELVDGEPILKVKGGVARHNYGFIPYVLIDSGLGNLSADGNAVKRYVGMLRYMLDLLVAESRDFSISDVVLKKTAWPWGVLTGKNATQVGVLDQKFGTYTPLPDGVEVKEMVPQVPPEALNQHLYRTSDYISAHAAPRSVRGLSEVGVRSGADRRLVIAEAASRYRYSEDAFKYGTAKVLSNCARIIKNVIPGDFRVWARTPTDEFDIEIDKDKMKEPFTCYVEFAPISEEDEYRRHDDLERLVAGGIVTPRWARSRMSNVDVIAMEMDEERERLRADPNLQGLVSQYVVGKLAQAIAKRGGAEAMAGGAIPPVGGVGMQGEAGRRMVPPISEKAVPGSPEAIQAQLAQLRSQTPMSPTQGRGVGAGGHRP